MNTNVRGPARPTPEPGAEPRILVVRFKQISDALLSLPVCVSLRQRWPRARIDYVLYEHIAPLFEGHRAIDNIVTITPLERARPLRFVRRAIALRREGYDMAIDLHATASSALLARLSGAPRVIGFDHHRDRAWLYRTRVPHRFEGSTVERKLQILEGVEPGMARVGDFRIAIGADEKQRMRERLEEAGVDLSRAVFAFATTSRREYKVWPMDHFARVIDTCVVRYGAQPIMLYGPGEQEHVDAVAARMQQRARAITGLRTANIRELATLLSVCDLFVGNEGGPRHISEAVGTPSLAIFAPPVPSAVWLPNPSPRQQAVDIRDALGLSERDFLKRQAEFKDECARYFALITPELVVNRLDAMVAGLRAAGEWRFPQRDSRGGAT